LNKIAKYLNQYITGAVYGESPVLDGYATDRSVLKIRPKVVAIPRTTKDIRKLVRFANQLALKNFKLPVTVRGTGLDKTGAAIGSGLIISMEKMNRIQEIDPRQRLVRLQAGVTLGSLNSALSLHGLTMPVTGDPCQTIGGLLANDHIGSLAASHGTLSSRVNQAEIVLSNGDIVQTERLSPRRLRKKKGAPGYEGELYRQLDNFLSDNIEALAGIEKGTRTGYATIPRVKARNGSFDLLPAFFGSQGTLGIVSEVILSCELAPELPQYFVAAFSNASAALGFVSHAADLRPSEINIYDVNLFREAIGLGKKFRPIKALPDNGIVAVIVIDEHNRRRRAKKLRTLIYSLAKSTRFAVSDEENYPAFIELQSILSLHLNSSTRAARLPLVDDVFIPNSQIKRYFSGIVELEEKYKITLPVFGSILANNYSVRPEIDLTSVAGRQFALAFLREYNDLVVSCDGSLAGGSAEGRLKAVFTNTHIGPELKELYQEFKDIFDPNNILNPGIKQNANLRAVVRTLRTSYDPGIIKE
jgi:FAD/FMN-containing dehydrogenase